MKKRKCKQCKQYKPREKGFATPKGFFCGNECIAEFLKGEREKQVRKAISKKNEGIKKEKAKARKAKSELNKNTLSWQHKQTQAAFNRMRVLEELLWFKERGEMPTCISCRRTLGLDQWCCGHFKTRGSYPNLRYDRRNTYLQHNHRCNMHLSGDIEGTANTIGYKRGLVDRFGEDEGRAIIEYCESSTQIKKWTCEELEQNRKEYRAEIRRLESLLGI